MSLLITNEKTKKLEHRLEELVSQSSELKFLVGFFYFSGISALYNSLSKNNEVVLKILVGLNVDKRIGGLVEYCEDDYEKLRGTEKVALFFQSIERSINSEQFDNKVFYEQISFFLELIKDGKLIIRKTLEPNHAKLYFFKMYNPLIRSSIYITGSSNLTKAGLHSQNELNIELSDHGNEDVQSHFDRLWETALPITEDDENKKVLIQTLKHKTLIAQPTPFEAYICVLKNYLESKQHKEIRSYVLDLLRRKRYQHYQYQLDAVRQALSVLEDMNGVIIADVVGLGKSIIASILGKVLNKRGIIICPPALMGDKQKQSGWAKYKEDFELYDWEIYSLGQLEQVETFLSDKNDFEVIIVDEAHRFRNQDTRDYDLLQNICRNKKVILLTATPFNNTPGDIFSMLKLFITPGRSNITLDNDLEGRFRSYATVFNHLSFILKNHNSKDLSKRKQSDNLYRKVFADVKYGMPQLDISKVKKRAKDLASEIRSVIEPVIVRRNRLDLMNDPVYSNEIKNLSKVRDPIELFFSLNKEQADFYDEVINSYFGIEGKFKGAVYRPYFYENRRAESLSGKENREKLAQDNLYDFMRRMLVKRFESSFGAFQQSVLNFKNIIAKIQKFIISSKGRYILDRKLLERISDYSEEDIEKELANYAERLEAENNRPKSDKVYEINKFYYKSEFLADVQADYELFTELLDRLSKLQLVKLDPKRDRLIKSLKNDIPKLDKLENTERKIVIFSEYIDTIKWLKPILENEFSGKVISVAGDLNSKKASLILKNFDATHPVQDNDYSILLTSDVLSEGFNLNRAGVVINYDIPWNPVRVIQRLGRINRISKKVFEELFIYNFFPTEQGANINKSREIASNKMFMIHNTLGEDSKIFSVEETPTPAALWNSIQQNPEAIEEESTLTGIRRRYYQLTKDRHELVQRISKFPPRIKIAKKHDSNSLFAFIRKGRAFFIKGMKEESEAVEEFALEEVLSFIESKEQTAASPLSSGFWDRYEKIKEHKDLFRAKTAEVSLEVKARNLLKSLEASGGKEIHQYLAFIRVLLEDIRDYKTLSEHTLRTISSWEGEKVSDVCSGILELKLRFGEDYLDKIKKQELSTEKEVIIAIENQKTELFNE